MSSHYGCSDVCFRPKVDISGTCNTYSVQRSHSLEYINLAHLYAARDQTNDAEIKPQRRTKTNFSNRYLVVVVDALAVWCREWWWRWCLR